MKLIGLIRLGRDAELRFTASGEPVASVTGAWNYGKKGEDGRRPTQWVDLALWGKRAESLAPYLTKGSLVEVVASDVHIESFERRDGTSGTKLVARIDDLEFAGQPREAAEVPSPAPRPAPRQAPAPAKGATGFEDMNDDVPW